MTTSTPPTSHSTGMADPPGGGRLRRRRGLRVALSVTAVLILLTTAGGVWAAYSFGPRFGFYLTKPSPERYAEIALDYMDAGYYATGPQWTAERARIEEAAAGAASIEELHAPLAAAAKVAGGKHSFFRDPSQTVKMTEDATAEFTTPTVTTTGGVTTVTAPPVWLVSEDLQRQYAQAVADGITDAAPTTCGWIVDLRGNTGGTMYPMLSGLAPLLPNGTAMTFRTRSGEDFPVTIHDDGAGLDSTTVAIDAAAKTSDRPIAILQDDKTASSGEAVLTAFRGLEGVESFGADSAGYSSSNETHSLYDGALLVVTGQVFVDRTGTSLNEEPIVADHTTIAEAADEAARSWLGSQGCG